MVMFKRGSRPHLVRSFLLVIVAACLFWVAYMLWALHSRPRIPTRQRMGH